MDRISKEKSPVETSFFFVDQDNCRGNGAYFWYDFEPRHMKGTDLG
jgi:hypothetical protein